MEQNILERIEQLKQRLLDLRSRSMDTASQIGIEAIEQELARTAARLPREWDVLMHHESLETLSADAPIDSQWWL